MEKVLNDENVNQFLIICNVSKPKNVRALCNAALAYNFKLILVGFKDLNFFNLLEESIYLKFENLVELNVYLSNNSIPLYGIEIVAGATSVLEQKFTKSIAIMPGNEGDGLNKSQKNIVDEYIYIPQYGDGTASLNVYIATTIVLHQYYLWNSKLE
jgi:tRNA G18 (ribose-2'-O)-methylase SpoU